MNDSNNSVPKNNTDFWVEEAIVKYSQEGDNCTSNNVNSLTIFTQDSGGGTYFVLETERWAFDDVNELVEMINDFIKRNKE